MVARLRVYRLIGRAALPNQGDHRHLRPRVPDPIGRQRTFAPARGAEARYPGLPEVDQAADHRQRQRHRAHQHTGAALKPRACQRVALCAKQANAERLHPEFQRAPGR